MCFPLLDHKRAERAMQTLCRLQDGHYYTKLPWKEGCSNFSDNYGVVLSRSTSLGRRLKKDPEIHAKYKDKINEMVSQGHAFEVASSEEHFSCKT